ncbi:hypothetical protein LKD42_00220 [Lachnospiraceae bacterium CLA-AA-H246]|uniref:Uncharacterized protein n=1 Tax=Hominisplanchenecus faecis TaxID=2885351 RepID=A0ABS8ET95_9FIRM|nr:hypothetical protein [Hominisplanchenecus faecis]MCC2147687.1 hypothetical protein [Hominisplanchenecus faecis]
MRKKEDLKKKDVIFQAKPDAIPYNYRISYKVSIICLMMYICCGRKGCSLIKLHLLGAALSNKRYERQLIKYLSSSIASDLIVRFDPTVNRALEYAIADEMIGIQANGSYKLLEKGRNLVKAIMSDKELLSTEKAVLEVISKKLTDDKIKKITEEWRYQDATN